MQALGEKGKIMRIWKSRRGRWINVQFGEVVGLLETWKLVNKLVLQGVSKT